MLKKVLVANRGEIAVRIIRACREMGIRTVAIYSEADKTALHKSLADEAVCIGEAPASKSYLNRKAIVEAACLTGCDSIHPTDTLIDLMGNKSKAKQTMKEAGVPVVPGSVGLVEKVAKAVEIANKIKYPVMLKASSGGGGKGIRIAHNDTELINIFDLVRNEAKNSFCDDSVYLEIKKKYKKIVNNPRHVEIQILADEHGNAIHLGERDCTIQRRNQKVLEETPSSAIDEKLRKKMGEIAVNAVKKIGYTNAGTIEFLLDSNGDFYFMEMNTRVQVEHPVTESVTGVDIIKEQIRIASGEELSFTQKQIRVKGHSLEARVNAENPNKNFMPCPGTITGLHLPGGNGIRVDTAIYQGYTIPMNYDSMIAKIIVHGRNREESIRKMKSALAEFVIEGVNTNIDFLLQILENENFVKNEYDTSFIAKEFQI